MTDRAPIEEDRGWHVQDLAPEGVPQLPMRRLTIIVAFFVTSAGFWLAPVATTHAQVNSEAALILRVLAYDRSLPDRAEDQVTILAVHGGSSRSCDPLVRALNQLGRAVSVGGMHARAVTHAYEGPDELLAAGREQLEAALLRIATVVR